MKKAVKYIGISLIVLMMVYTLYSSGFLDTRFWFYDKKVYSPFYSGIYVCGVDIEPGSYDVEIKGGSQDTGIVYVWNVDPNVECKELWVMNGDKGFHFSIEEGETLEVSVKTGRDMKIKKAG